MYPPNTTFLQAGDLAPYKTMPKYPKEEIKKIENIFNKKYEYIGWKLTINGNNLTYGYPNGSYSPYYLSYMNTLVLEVSSSFIFKFKEGFIPEEILKLVLRCINLCKPLLKQYDWEYGEWANNYNSKFGKGGKDDGK